MSESGPDRSLETRVEDLFSNAVERQVAERRAVGRALEELGQLVRSLDERVARVEQSEAERDRDLRGALDGLARDVRESVGSLVDRVEVTSSRLGDVVGEGTEQFDLRQAELTEALQQAVVAASTPLDVGIVADAVAHRIASTNLDVDVRAIAEAVSGRVPTALQVASAVDASIRDGLVSVVDEIRGEVERLREDLGEVREQVGETQAALQPLSGRLGDELGELTDAVGAMRGDLRTSVDEGERILEVVRAEVGDAASAPDRAVAALRVEFAGQAERLDALRTDIGDHVTSMRAGFDTFGDQIEGIRGMSEAFADQSTQMDRLLAELPEGVLSTIDARAGDLSGAVQELVKGFAAELGKAIELVAERVEEAQATVDATLGRVDEQVGEITEDMAALRILAKEDSTSLADQAAAMEQMAADVAGLGDTIGRVMGEVQADLEVSQDAALDRLEQTLADARLQVEESLGEVRAHVEEATAALDETNAVAIERLDAATENVVNSSTGLRTRLEVALDDIASAARIDAEEARDEVVAAGARLDLLFDRLAGFERAVIDHLQARDAQLARERQLVTETLVEQLSTAMGKAQRKRLGRQLGIPTDAEIRSRDEVALPAPAPLEVRTPEPGVRDLRGPDAGRRRTDLEAAPEKAAPKKPAAKPAAESATAKKAAAKKAAAKPTRRVSRQDLVDVKGLGPSKVDALIEAFGSAAAVAKASVSELAEVPGISARLAQAIRDALD